VHAVGGGGEARKSLLELIKQIKAEKIFTLKILMR
jgi:hypothetical protein